MRVFVTGAAGQLGSAIIEAFAARADLFPFTHSTLDISDEAAVAAAVRGTEPDAIVNCAAYNDVDGAEDHPAPALSANAFGVLALARAAKASGATLVHYSTDFVFDGDPAVAAPYTEADEPRPQSSYATSKLLGEWFAADAGSYYVLRVESLFGGSQRRSSIDRIIRAIEEGSPVRVFVDRVVSPSYVVDVADATWQLLSRRAANGLYHCVNSGATTWHDLAQVIGTLLGRSAELVPVRVMDVSMRAKRPQYCALSNRKLAAAGIEMPTWQDALARHLRTSFDALR